MLQISRQLSNDLVVQFGVSLGERDGCEIQELTAEQAAALYAALEKPNGGVTFDGVNFETLPIPSEPLESYLEALRAERDRRLLESDWTQLPDAPVDSELWRPYRQALRDFPSNVKDPTRPQWPVPPGGVLP